MSWESMSVQFHTQSHQGRSQTLNLGWARLLPQEKNLFLILLLFSPISSSFPHFLPQFGPPRVGGPPTRGRTGPAGPGYAISNWPGIFNASCSFKFKIDSIFLFLNLELKLQSTKLTAHNWQNWKRVLLTSPCHDIYRDEAVGLKSCKHTWKN